MCFARSGPFGSNGIIHNDPPGNALLALVAMIALLTVQSSTSILILDVILFFDTSTMLDIITHIL